MPEETERIHVRAEDVTIVTDMDPTKPRLWDVEFTTRKITDCVTIAASVNELEDLLNTHDGQDPLVSLPTITGEGLHIRPSLIGRVAPHRDTGPTENDVRRIVREELRAAT